MMNPQVTVQIDNQQIILPLSLSKSSLPFNINSQIIISGYLEGSIYQCASITLSNPNQLDAMTNNIANNNSYASSVPISCSTLKWLRDYVVKN